MSPYVTFPELSLTKDHLFNFLASGFLDLKGSMITKRRLPGQDRHFSSSSPCASFIDATFTESHLMCHTFTVGVKGGGFNSYLLPLEVQGFISPFLVVKAETHRLMRLASCAGTARMSAHTFFFLVFSSLHFWP